jgi:hypothetical protein
MMNKSSKYNNLDVLKSYPEVVLDRRADSGVSGEEKPLVFCR